MELLSLDLKNFKRIKSANVRFPNGILAVIGPNEAGKSTIIKGILFALFGSSAFDSYDNVVNFKSKTAKISLDFIIKNEKYRVYRVLKEYKSGTTQTDAEFVEVLDNDRTRTLATGVTEVDKLVEKTIGFSINELTASNIIAQKKLDKISKMTPKKWEELFNEFLNLKGFGKAIDELKNDKKEKKSDLKNDRIKFNELDKQKDVYCEKFHKLIRLSKEHLKDASIYRDLNNSIEINSEYLRIIKKYIEKKRLKERLEEKLDNTKENLDEKKEELNRIRKLEEENEKLKIDLKEYENIDKDDDKLLCLKEDFNQYKNILDDISKIEKRIKHLEKLEKRLEDCEEEFKDYDNIPEQLSYFREIEQLFSSLEVFYKERDQLKTHLNTILESERENKQFKEELEELSKTLSYKVEFLKAEDLFHHFQAELKQIRQERFRKKDLEREIKQISRNCPSEIPDTIEGLEKYKEKQKSKIDEGFLKYILKRPKKIILILTIAIILSIIPSLFGYYFFIGISSAITVIFFIYLFYQFHRIKVLIDTIDDLLELKKELIKIDNKLVSVLEKLNKRYNKIKKIILDLPEYYSEDFKAKHQLDDQEVSLNLYFKKLGDKLKETESKQQDLEGLIRKNNEIIKEKPKVEEKLRDVNSKITKTRSNLDPIMKDFKPKFKVHRIDVIYNRDQIDFHSVKNILSEIEKKILSDLDIYRSLKSEIEDLEKKLEEKPTRIDQLEEKESIKVDLFEKMIETGTSLTKKYFDLIEENEKIEEQIQKLTSFGSSLEKLTNRIHKDKRHRDKLEANISANEKHIRRKPELINIIKKIQDKIDSIIKKINAIVFPEIPSEIKQDFNKEKPQICQEKLDNKLQLLRKKKNEINGKMREINSQREEIRAYLKENEFIIHDFFKIKENIKQLEEEIKIYQKSIDLVEQVNRQIWDMQMPYITSYISKFLPKITMGRYRNLVIQQPDSRRRKRYEFKILEETKESFIDKKYLSGGTEDQILLAIRVAVAMSLLPQSKGHYPKFLFIDEAFASSDSERRMEILNWLTKDLNSIFSQIIIISHQKEIIEKIPFYYKLNQGNLVDKVIPSELN
ncbi:MAG: AAA family ATPase [Candidatus Lokiarchaeota archaeon]|nr:AAA family ATPase [Candidatus Lokiarchaeota archaeon]